MRRSRQPHFAVLTLELDSTGGPIRALLSIEDGECVTVAHTREEFAPFDSLADVSRWWIRAIRQVVPVRPG